MGYRLFHKDHALESLRGTKLFLPLCVQNHGKTVFSVAIINLRSLPFGLCNVTASFEQLLKLVTVLQ